ncbi:peptidylprolyl isomerase [Flavobacterium sp.]|uniref:peptidylprolyl isomerase n=1 Tax=Flavobacterium sp. TaxID=239 RepID=UPI003751AC5D
MKFKILCLFFLGLTIANAQTTKKTVKKAIKTSKTVAVKPAVVTQSVLPVATPNLGIFAEIETSKGKIVVQLEYKKTPVTVANFVSLAEGTNPIVGEKFKGKKFYNGIKFHRVIADFMIQGGDPDGNGSGGPGYAFKDEFTDLQHHSAGILSMANAGPKTNGSQFFITHRATPHLNGKHTVFGIVVTGMDVVNAIAQNDVINSITIVRKGDDAKKFDAVKTFGDYFANKAEDDKKQAVIDSENRAKQAIVDAENKAKQAIIDAEKKKEYVAKYGAVMMAKSEALKKMQLNATKTNSGLQYIITQKGTDKKPADGTNVFIHYAGYLEDGTLFDSSYEEVNKTYGKFDQARASQNGYKPMAAQAGKYQFIPGFVEGLNAMSLGDKATLFIPSNLGYGERGAGGVIPPNSNIIFEVELLETMPTK